MPSLSLKTCSSLYLKCDGGMICSSGAQIRQALNNVWREVITLLCPVHYSTLGQYLGPDKEPGARPKSHHQGIKAIIQQLNIPPVTFQIQMQFEFISVQVSFESAMITAPPNDGGLCQDAKYLDVMKTKHRYEGDTL